MDIETWVLEDFFWLMVGGQVLLVGVFAWLVVHGVNAGLRSVNRLTDDIQQRSIDDMQPLDVADVPTEIRPLITHTNDLLLRAWTIPSWPSAVSSVMPRTSCARPWPG